MCVFGGGGIDDFLLRFFDAGDGGGAFGLAGSWCFALGGAVALFLVVAYIVSGADEQP